MTKYKLLKDLPMAVSWTIVELEKYNWELDTYTISWFYANQKIELWKIQNRKTKEWLEEIKEPKSVWDLQEGDKYYCIDSQGFIGTGEWKNNLRNISERKNGNVFLNIDEAEKECDRRNAIGEIQQYCWENNIDTNWKKGKANFIFIWDRRYDKISKRWFDSTKPSSPLGYFFEKDAEKILENFLEELELIYE